MYRKNLFLLASCQCLTLSSTSLMMTTSALVGMLLAPEPVLATLPLGLVYLSVMLTMIPASMLMKHYGRRVGFALGGCAGLVGGMIAGFGIYHDSFLLFCVGSSVIGIANGFAQYYRFAAAEIVAESYKSRAIAWVLAGGLVAAFIGPNAGNLTRDLLPGTYFSASYIALGLFSLGVVLIQWFIRIPLPSVEESSGPRRPLGRIMMQPAFLVAVLCAMIAYGTMNLLMTTTPLAMNLRHMDFDQTAIVIQWHLVGMFAPSFFTGHLIYRFGLFKIMFAGAIMLLTCILIALAGQTFPHFVVGLVLLGVGWNFLYIGGTTLLTEVYTPAEKGSIQGINEFLVFTTTAFTALSSGYLHHTLGWEALNRYIIPVIFFAAFIIALLGWRANGRKPQNTGIKIPVS